MESRSIRCESFDFFGFGPQKVIAELKIQDCYLSAAWEDCCPNCLRLIYSSESILDVLKHSYYKDGCYRWANDEAIKKILECYDKIIRTILYMSKNLLGTEDVNNYLESKYPEPVHVLSNIIFKTLSENGCYHEFFDVWDWVEEWVNKDYEGQFLELSELLDSDGISYRSNYLSQWGEIRYSEYNYKFGGSSICIILVQTYSLNGFRKCYASSVPLLREIVNQFGKNGSVVDMPGFLDYIEKNCMESVVFRDIYGSKFLFYYDDIMSDAGVYTFRNEKRDNPLRKEGVS